MPNQPQTIRYKLSTSSLPDAEDLFADLDEAYEEVLRLRGEIERVFNASPAREMLGGFVVPGRADLSVQWIGTRALIEIPILPTRKGTRT